jgi:hypothetical protein
LANQKHHKTINVCFSRSSNYVSNYCRLYISIELIADCIKYIEEFAGKGTFTREDMVEAIKRNNYNSEAALDALYGMHSFAHIIILTCCHK